LEVAHGVGEIYGVSAYSQTGGFMAAKKAMKGKKSVKAKSLHQGKKLEAQKSLRKGGGGTPYFNYNLTNTQVS
jgi:hypothetical protein